MFPNLTETSKAIFNPAKLEEYFNTQKAKANWNDAITNIVAVEIVLAILSFVMLFVPGGVAPTNAFEAALSGPVGALMGVVVGLFSLALVLVLIHFVSKVLGGKGDLRVTAYLYSLFVFGMLPLSILLGVIGHFAFLLWPAGLLSMAVGIYSLYGIYKIVKSAYGLNQKNAIIAIILWMVAIFIVSFVISFVIILLSLAVSGAGGTFLIPGLK